jgi:hypothetical protein
LVSLHGTGLYERFPPRTDDPEVARLVAGYLDGQRALQAQLAEELGAGAEELARNQGLLAAWDDVSLAVCRDAPGPHVVPAVPVDGGERADLTLTRTGAARGSATYALDPWPFATPQLAVRTEGRRLDGPAPDEATLRAALDRAPVLTIEITLHAA